jgi:hypothetical protein
MSAYGAMGVSDILLANAVITLKGFIYAANLNINSGFSNKNTNNSPV